MFTGKEILNTSIDDLLPDVVQVFHRYLIEDAIKYSNLSYIFKRQRDALFKGKNGLIFNILLYVKPAPNLSFGLIYISYLQKIPEQNFILILDRNLIINGFTNMNQIGSNFTINNNYGLSYNINGHHIGMIIPEILLQMNYDIKTNSFYLSKTNIDLKGNLYSINNFKDLDDKFSKILEILKQKKISEINNENKLGTFEEFDDFVKFLNSQQIKSYSIFFRIEMHSFISGKYKYYRIYIINDFLSGNDNSLSTPSNVNSNITDDDNDNFKENANKKKLKFKDLNESNNYTITGNKLFKQEFGSKLIRLKTEQNRKSNLLKKDEVDKLNNNKNQREINLIEEDNKNNKQNNNNDSSNNNNNKSKNINFSKPSNPSSIITQLSAESAEFNKLKNEIINKNDSLYIKLMKYLSFIFILFNILLIAYDYYYSKNIINKMVKYLSQNLFFVHTKICIACIYNAGFNLKLIKKNIIDNTNCNDNTCKNIYSKLLLKCLKEVRYQKFNISYFYSDFQEIFNQNLIYDLYIYNRKYTENLELNIDNYLNLMIAQGMKVISNLSEYYDNNTEKVNVGIIEIYLENLLSNSLKYFSSNYIGFYGEEKKRRCQNVANNPPLRFFISVIVSFVLISFFLYYLSKIHSMVRYFLDRLINFSSPSFDEYLKKLDELKKKFRDDTNEEEDKNLDDLDLKNDDIDGKNEIDSKNNIEKKDNSLNNKNKKKKKTKQNKIQQQRLKKKKIMIKYFLSLTLFFGISISIIILISILYYLLTILITTKMKNNYYNFDSILEQINKVYFESFKIFLNFKSQLEIYLNSKNISNLNIPRDKDIERPKIGNALLEIIHNSKYSSESLQMIDDIYNNNACKVLSNNDNATYQVCENLFSSILTKGMEQAIVQMSIIITSCVDELNSLKDNATLVDIYGRNTNYFNYEIFVGEFMLFIFKNLRYIPNF